MGVFVNIAVRGLSIAAKFVSIALISSVLNDQDLGIYFFVLAVASVFSALFGLQLYYPALKIFNQTGEMRVYPTQFLLYLFMYGALGLAYPHFNVPFDLGWLLLLVCAVEHASLELNRLLISIKKPLLANMVLAITAMKYLVVAAYLYCFDVDKLSLLLPFWEKLAAAYFVLYCILIFGFLWRGGLLKSGASFSILKTLLLGATYYFVLQVLNQICLFTARFTLEAKLSIELFAIYSLLFSFANIVNVFVSASVVSVKAPNLMKVVNLSSDRQRAALNSAYGSCFLVSVAISVLLLIGLVPVLHLIGKASYSDYYIGFVVLVVASCFSSMSQMIQLEFVAFCDDKYSLYSYVISAFISVTTAIYFVDLLGIYGAFLSYMMAAFSLFVSRVIMLKNVRKRRVENARPV